MAWCGWVWLQKSLLEHEEITKVKNIASVQFGQHLMECWYFSPFPKEVYPDGPVDCLYFWWVSGGETVCTSGG